MNCNLENLVTKWRERADRIAPDDNFGGSPTESAEREAEAEALYSCALDIESFAATWVNQNTELRSALQDYMDAIRGAQDQKALMAAIKEADDKARAILAK